MISRIKPEGIERHLFVSGLPADAGQFAKSVRSHWGVENSLHYYPLIV
ncbi:MAG: hypothetical protein LBC27_02545 [Spirochaetaceae bacterium]|nr:hypothetical protein [Spirochaetaceae bacterium]